MLKEQELRDQLRREIIGQNKAVDAVVRAPERARLDVHLPKSCMEPIQAWWL